MRLWHHIKALARNLTRKRRVEEELEEEIRSYQTLLEDEKVQAGTQPGLARREALMDFGGTEQVKEQVRDVRTGHRLETLAVDLRQSWRGLRRNPGLADGRCRWNRFLAHRR